MSEWLILRSSTLVCAALKHSPHRAPRTSWQCRAALSTSCAAPRHHDPRVRDLGRKFQDEYAAIRDQYATPKYPIVLAHGLLGFSELQISSFLPTVQYWHGIKDALAAQGASVLTASVPPSSSIEDRAAKLADDIRASATRRSDIKVSSSSGQHTHTKSAATTDDSSSSIASNDQDAERKQATPVNIIAHSMGGLDARYMISHLLPRTGIRVASLTTISTPHRGSPFADHVLATSSGVLYLPRLYGALRRAGFGTRAFEQLTTRYMAEEFNPNTPDDPSVRYFSYGAVMRSDTPLLSPFRIPRRVVERYEGANDGLVSVESSRWGTYEGTLVGVNHLDLINWPNRVRWTVREWMGMKRSFNAVAFYLSVSDMLAREGL